MCSRILLLKVAFQIFINFLHSTFKARNSKLSQMFPFWVKRLTRISSCGMSVSGKETSGRDEARCCKIQKDSWLCTFPKKDASFASLRFSSAFSHNFYGVYVFTHKTLVFSFFPLAHTEFIAELGLAVFHPKSASNSCIIWLRNFSWLVWKDLALFSSGAGIHVAGGQPEVQQGNSVEDLSLEPGETSAFWQPVFQLSWNSLSVATSRDDKEGSPP